MISPVRPLGGNGEFECGWTAESALSSFELCGGEPGEEPFNQKRSRQLKEIAMKSFVLDSQEFFPAAVVDESHGRINSASILVFPDASSWNVPLSTLRNLFCKAALKFQSDHITVRSILCKGNFSLLYSYIIEIGRELQNAAQFSDLGRTHNSTIPHPTLFCAFVIALELLEISSASWNVVHKEYVERTVKAFCEQHFHSPAATPSQSELLKLICSVVDPFDESGTFVDSASCLFNIDCGRPTRKVESSSGGGGGGRDGHFSPILSFRSRSSSSSSLTTIQFRSRSSSAASLPVALSLKSLSTDGNSPGFHKSFCDYRRKRALSLEDSATTTASICSPEGKTDSSCDREEWECERACGPSRRNSVASDASDGSEDLRVVIQAVIRQSSTDLCVKRQNSILEMSGQRAVLSPETATQLQDDFDKFAIKSIDSFSADAEPTAAVVVEGDYSDEDEEDYELAHYHSISILGTEAEAEAGDEGSESAGEGDSGESSDESGSFCRFRK